MHGGMLSNQSASHFVIRFVHQATTFLMRIVNLYSKLKWPKNISILKNKKEEEEEKKKKKKREREREREKGAPCLMIMFTCN
jgi:hypothetical protein